MCFKFYDVGPKTEMLVKCKQDQETWLRQTHMAIPLSPYLFPVSVYSLKGSVIRINGGVAQHHDHHHHHHILIINRVVFDFQATCKPYNCRLSCKADLYPVGGALA